MLELRNRGAIIIERVPGMDYSMDGMSAYTVKFLTEWLFITSDESCYSWREHRMRFPIGKIPWELRCND